MTGRIAEPKLKDFEAAAASLEYRWRDYSGYAIVQKMSCRVTFYSVGLEKEILELPAGFVARFLRYA
jgi:hypothetical protein